MRFNLSDFMLITRNLGKLGHGCKSLLGTNTLVFDDVGGVVLSE